jgi:hypothetical protein
LEFHDKADETIMDKNKNGTKNDRHDIVNVEEEDDNEEVRFGIIIVERETCTLQFSVKDVDTTIKVGFLVRFFFGFMKPLDGNDDA